MVRRGRPRLLNPALLKRAITSIEAGLSPSAAASEAGVAPRSLRRWRAEGQRQHDALPPEAQRALAFERVRASAARDEIDWRESARFLETQHAERWAEVVGAADQLDADELAFDDLTPEATSFGRTVAR